MARVIEVVQSADSRLDDFRDLTTADRRPDRPGGKGLVIAEGVLVVRRLLGSPYPVRALLGTQRRIAELDAEIDSSIPAYVTSTEMMADVVGFHLNRGVLAVADRAQPWTLTELAARSQRLAVLEGVGDHENLGALFRNVAALGVDGVILGPGCSDPLYRRSVRVSMGHVLNVPFTTAESWPGALEFLRSTGFQILALTPRPEAVPLNEVTVDGPVAVLLGSEGPGLSDAAIEASDRAVRIPMAGEVDSLNIATAGAVAFYSLGTG